MGKHGRLVIATIALLGAAWAGPAAAVPGQALAPSMKVARAQKPALMGVTYYLDKAGNVAGETWNSELAGWTAKEADRLRALAVGKRKLKARQTAGQSRIDFRYTDGAVVRYNLRRGKIITMDVFRPGFSFDSIAKGGYKLVQDWKEAPWQGKPW